MNRFELLEEIRNTLPFTKSEKLIKLIDPEFLEDLTEVINKISEEKCQKEIEEMVQSGDLIFPV